MPTRSFCFFNMFVRSVIPFQSLRNGLQLLILVGFTVCLSVCQSLPLSLFLYFWDQRERGDAFNIKKDLIPTLNANVVIMFLKHVCPQCHTIPKSKEWATVPNTGKFFCLFVCLSSPLSLFTYFWGLVIPLNTYVCLQCRTILKSKKSKSKRSKYR